VLVRGSDVSRSLSACEMPSFFYFLLVAFVLVLGAEGWQVAFFSTADGVKFFCPRVDTKLLRFSTHKKKKEKEKEKKHPLLLRKDGE